MAFVDLFITLNSQSEAGLSKKAEELKSKGLQGIQVLPRAGAIYGSSDSSNIDAFRRVDGVESVREGKTIQKPPVREDIPQ